MGSVSRDKGGISAVIVGFGVPSSSSWLSGVGGPPFNVARGGRGGRAARKKSGGGGTGGGAAEASSGCVQTKILPYPIHSRPPIRHLLQVGQERSQRRRRRRQLWHAFALLFDAGIRSRQSSLWKKRWLFFFY